MPDLPRLAGSALAVPLGALAHLRRGKPMHPRGVVLDGVLERFGAPGDLGVPWLAGGGEDRVAVRISRGAGLPAPLPDLLGLAVRLPGPVDLLFSTAGSGRLTRWLPVLRRDAAAVYSSVMGYRSPAGSLFLVALPDPVMRGLPSDPHPLARAVAARRPLFTLAVARASERWRPFARLRLLGPVPGLDPDLRFDPVRNPPPGLVADGPMARLRAPSYAAAQQARGTARVAQVLHERGGGQVASVDGG